MDGENVFTYPVNSYLGVLLITIVGALMTLVIVRGIYQDAFYQMVGRSSAANILIVTP